MTGAERTAHILRQVRDAAVHCERAGLAGYAFALRVSLAIASQKPDDLATPDALRAVSAALRREDWSAVAAIYEEHSPSPWRNNT